MGHARFPLCTIWTSTLHSDQFYQVSSSNYKGSSTNVISTQVVSTNTMGIIWVMPVSFLVDLLKVSRSRNKKLAKRTSVHCTGDNFINFHPVTRVASSRDASRVSKGDVSVHQKSLVIIRPWHREFGNYKLPASLAPVFLLRYFLEKGYYPYLSRSLNQWSKNYIATE